MQIHAFGPYTDIDVNAGVDTVRLSVSLFVCLYVCLQPRRTRRACFDMMTSRLGV
jgi:hypothetical protein